jgi:hypothetical protein
LSDIWDGKNYKDLGLGHHDLTCTVNSDGVPAFKSSNSSLYPLLLSINEASYPIRRKHTMVAGLWFGSGKPNFDLFLAPFVKDARALAKENLKWKFEGTKFRSKVYFPIFTADAVARCAVQGIKQFNGQYGCPWCLDGGSLHSLPNNKTKRIYLPVQRSKIKHRTRSTFLEHLEQLSNLMVTEKATSYLGVKSASILLSVPKFNIVDGFVFDYMHTCLLGVVRTFTELWFNSKNHANEYYLGRKLKAIDAIFTNISCPSEIARVPRSLLQRRFWKSSEWKTWLFVSPPILQTFLPQQYLDHFLYFSKAIFVLCSSNITYTEISKAEKYLFKFVKLIPSLYGESCCSSNTHLLLHAADCVRHWGPLFSYSAFQFENFNQVVLNSFQGSRLVAKQVCNKICERISVENFARNYKFSLLGLEFYKSQMFNTIFVTKHYYVGSAVLLGLSESLTLSNNLNEQIHTLGYFPTSVHAFKKCIVKGVLFDVKRNTKRYNRIFQSGETIYILNRIIMIDSVQGKLCVFIANEMNYTSMFNNVSLVNHIDSNEVVIQVDNVDKIKFVCKKSSDNIDYIVKLPNYIEIE